MKNDEGGKDEVRERLEEFARWKRRYESEDESPRELFQQVSHIALYMGYDLIDKLRFWEKETLQLSEEEIERRIPHVAALLENLRTAYLDFSDVDL